FVRLDRAVGLGPGADDVACDGDRLGAFETVGMGAGNHRADLFAVEPAARLELHLVGPNIGAERFGVAADHQRRGERPRLAGVVARAAVADAGFLLRLAADGVLDRLARLHEAGEARIHAGREPRLAAEEGALFRDVDGEHDDHRVGAREVLGAAGWAVA